MTEVKNLNTKHISEFMTEDTIYVKLSKDNRGITYLADFINYYPDNRLVEVRINNKENNHREDQYDGQVFKVKLHNCGLYGKSVTNSDHSHFFWFDGSGYALHPLEVHKISENGVHVSEHPSYGMIGFSRASGPAQSLFGSSIQTKQTISLTIKRAEHKRDLNNDWFHGREQLIQIELSQNQFAELITSLNMGDGIPCTIRYLGRERMPDPPFLNKMDLFHEEFKRSSKNLEVDVKKTVDQATEILKNKSSITKGDREILLNNINKLCRFIDDHLPFMAKQFTESMEKTVTEAKAEIEAFVENKIRTSGLNALGFSKENDTPLIEN